MNRFKHLSITAALTSLLVALPSDSFSSDLFNDPSGPPAAASAVREWNEPSAAGYSVADLDHLEKGSAGDGKVGTRNYYTGILANPQSSQQHRAEAGFLLAKLYIFAQEGPMNFRKASQLFFHSRYSMHLPPETRAEACLRLMEIEFISLSPCNRSVVRELYEVITRFGPRVNSEHRQIAQYLMLESDGVSPALFGAVRRTREFLMGCEQTHPYIRVRAQAELAKMYYDGLGGPVDYGQARTFFAEIMINPKASMKNKAQARLVLAKMHYYGQGGDVDYVKSRSLYENFTYGFLTQGGRSEMHLHLAKMYYHGRGTDVDYKKASALYLKAVNNIQTHPQNRANACLTLGNMYYHGLGCNKNSEDALKLFNLVNNTPNLPGQLYQIAAQHINAINKKLREQASTSGASVLGSKRKSPDEEASSKKSRQ